MDDTYIPQREPFGAWLLRQEQSPKWFSPLAKAARADRRYPKAGSVDEVRKHMSAGGADAEVFEMLDDAELDYAAL